MTGRLLQVVVMGVSSTGKSTVGSAVAAHLGWDFVEGDDLHPPSNVAKMEAGEALDDDDRAPWLDRVSDRAEEQSAQGRSSVLTCSALKRVYRDRLRRGVPEMSTTTPSSSSPKGSKVSNWERSRVVGMKWRSRCCIRGSSTS